MNKRLHVWNKRFQSFFLKAAHGYPLAALRIGLSVILLLQAYYIYESKYDFYAADGIMQKSTARDLDLILVPSIEWVMSLVGETLHHRSAVDVFFYSYVMSLIFLALGLFTQVASIAVWLLHWILNNSSPHTRYGIDIYAHIFLFYLMFSPCGKHWSIDAWRRKTAPQPGRRERLVLRVMQLHLCLSYLVTGLLKAQGEQWWNGELIWRALTLPIYQQWDLAWLGQWPFLLMLAGWLTLFFEIGYAVFIWPRLTRWFWITGMLGLHLGIALFLGLHLFGFIMCVLTLALFAFSAEPHEFWAYTGIPERPGRRTRRFYFIPSSSIKD